MRMWRGLVAGLAVAAAAGAAPAVRPLAAQGYFGQNQVQYDRFQWRVIETEHFRIHYYKEEKAAAEDAARMAERAYARLSRILGHQFREKKPVVLYASRTDFAQNNIFGDLGEGTGGVTDFQRQRNVLPFTGDYRSFEHVLTHEMVHQFQYDVFSRGRAGANIQALAAVQPPLWFMEGMAEYLSLGPDHRFTDMVMRDAALNGNLPTIEAMTVRPDRYFPYRFGMSLYRWIGERWGDQVIGQILEAVPNVGIERAFRRELGMSLDELSDEWKEDLQKKYLPQVANLDRPRRFSQVVLNRKRSQGDIFISPALSDDGSRILFLSNGNFWRGQVFIDLWMADARTGKRIRRVVKSTTNPNAEELRLLYSQAAFSPDGQTVAYVGQRQGRDVLYLLNLRTNRTQRIDLPLEGVLSPVFSPDGKQLAFAGNNGGLTDLCVVNADGSGFRRLTNDRHGDYMPNWSPDGRYIAFASDRGGATDFEYLRFSHLQISLYDLQTQQVTVLPNQSGLNINPQWGPDSRNIAYVSDRGGVPNLFMFDMQTKEHYQLTNMTGGVAAITEYSPAITWARKADRLAFVHYENGDYTVWGVDNPRSLKREPYRDSTAAPVPVVASGVPGTGIAPSTPGRPLPGAQPGATAGVTRPGVPGVTTPPTTLGNPPSTGSAPTVATAPELPPINPFTRSRYRGVGGFRRADSLDVGVAGRDTNAVTVAQMLDSADFALPDPTRFRDVPYKVRYEADYVARPTIGYAQDNFGQGLFGGTTIVMSDLLGNNRLAFSGAVNGRIQDAFLFASYTNLSGRLDYNLGFQRFPFFFFSGSSAANVPGNPGLFEQTTRLRRLVQTSGSWTALFPRNRFDRFEFGLNLNNLTQSELLVTQLVDQTGFPLSQSGVREEQLANLTFFEPTVAFVSDNTLFGYTAPISGRRMRFSVDPALGSRTWMGYTADYRRYDPLVFNFLTIATRFTGNFRVGKDEAFWPQYIGNPNGIMWVRGYDRANGFTFGCNPQITGGLGCSNAELLGSRAFVGSAELRFPLIRRFDLGLVPVQLPPIDGGLFFDVGGAWQSGQDFNLRAPVRDGSGNIVPYDIDQTRYLLRSWGFSVRVNLFNFALLRWDYATPLDRPIRRGFWTWSIGPSF